MGSPLCITFAPLMADNMLIDTHTHIYAGDFDDDREAVIARALEAGVEKMILPNIDESSVEPMLELSRQHPGCCYPLMGLHPSSVGEDYVSVLDRVALWFEREKFCGVGEIGIDLYWDVSHREEQEEAFRQQLRWAVAMDLPVVIHVRNSFEEVWKVLEKEHRGELKGIFHCFSGTPEQARRVLGAGFFLGIGGVVTFRNNQLERVVEETGPEGLLLETDAPWLSPVPFRGRRNEPAQLIPIAQKVASVLGIPLPSLASITTTNARQLFRI